MNDELMWQGITLIVLLILSAFFSSAETSLTAVSPIRLRTLEEQGNKRAKVVLFLLKHQSKMLSAILIGNNLVNTYMASLASMIAYNFGGYAVSIATFIITFLILVFGEITPKTLAARDPDKMALSYAPIIRFLMWILTPVIWFINLFAKLILRLFGVKEGGQTVSITESELNTIIDVSHEEGVIEAEEREMIKNVFEFTDAKASQIMVPRVHVTMIPSDSTYQDILDVYARDHFTRMPVFENSPDNIIGIINMKDMILLDPKEPFDLHKMLRKPYFTIENKSISDLMQEMQKDQYNMTIVLDEYGELAGIITVEDIIEEIVGEVQDEYDTNEKDNIRQVARDKYKVKGYISLHDLNDELDLNLDSEDFDSIGGLIIEVLGRFPVLGESITLDNGVILRVVKLNKNRIEDVILQLPEGQEKSPQEETKQSE